MPPDTILEVRGVGKRFGGLVALDGVSFQVERGSIFSVIGPNGAGKTTLFSCLVGSQRPTSGSIRFKGKEIAGLRNDQVVARGVVRTHQVVRPFRDMTVTENVSVGALFGTHQRHNLSRLHLEGDVPHRLDVAVEDVEVLHAQGAHPGTPSASSPR